MVTSNLFKDNEKVKAFLLQLHNEFSSPTIIAKIQSSYNKSLQTEFSSKLQNYADKFEADVNNKNTGINQLQREVNSAMSAIQENMNKVMIRGENLNNLEKTTDGLRGHSNKFAKTATSVKKKMWFSNFRMKLILVGALLLLLLVIILIICYQAGAFNPKPAVASTQNSTTS